MALDELYYEMLAMILGIQIVTGVLLAMHYQPSVAMAFASVEHTSMYYIPT